MIKSTTHDIECKFGAFLNTEERPIAYVASQSTSALNYVIIGRKFEK